MTVPAMFATLAVADEPAAPTDCAPYTFYYPVGEGISMNYYPDHLDGSGISGKATIECTVLEGGKLSCVVLSETPEGYGFGRATVKLFQDKARVKAKTPGGKICTGGKHSFTYGWHG